MVNLEEENKFWAFIAEKNSYVQHKPNGDMLKGELRFSTYNDESTQGDTTKLGSPRLELMDRPTGSLQDNGGGFQYDVMSRTLRIIAKVKKDDYADRLAVHQRCKAALVEISQYITQQQNDGPLCTNRIIKMFDTDAFQYELLENVTSDGSFAGCQMRVRFKAKISQTEVNYGVFTYP